MKSFKQYLTEGMLLESKLKDFIDFASDHLKLENTPKITLVQVRDDNMTTANYCPNSKTMKIYAKNRALFDVARSIAHELVHHSQNEKGQNLDGTTGSDCENEANAVAGQIIRIYGEKNPEFYEE
jgi:Zn-dependent peptidase ImmA (M78 family)